MKRFHQYLLTHHPLLWNTRVAWVLSANGILHLLFFLGGLGAVTAKTLVNHYSASSVGGDSLFAFSTLCSLLVVIVWCIFYLRNNAFKSFYRLSKFYLAKEFGIIFIILLTTVSYSQSFEWGVRLRVRSITGEKEFAYEMTEINKGLVYVPVAGAPYFVLNNCAEKARRRNGTELNITFATPGQYYNGEDSLLVNEALARPGAFSYAHYCRRTLGYETYPTESAETISARNKQWLAKGRHDSVRQSVEQLFAVLNKYGVDYRLNAEELTAAVFKDSLFTLRDLIPAARFDYQYGERENKQYFNENGVQQLFGLIEDCQPKANNWREIKATWNVMGYIALSLSLFMLCYRRFSRKVFLISVVGILVWAILIGLIGMGSYNGKDGILALLLFLCAVFLGAALGLLNSRSGKTTAGVLLTWHAYLAPFAIMFTVALIDSYHSEQLYKHFSSSADAGALMQQYYPFSTWVVKHEADIFLANLLATLCYVAFVFNGFAKRWHLLPEE